jgi:hypothetical protein
MLLMMSLLQETWQFVMVLKFWVITTLGMIFQRWMMTQTYALVAILLLMGMLKPHFEFYAYSWLEMECFSPQDPGPRQRTWLHFWSSSGVGTLRICQQLHSYNPIGGRSRSKNVDAPINSVHNGNKLLSFVWKVDVDHVSPSDVILGDWCIV